MIVSMKKGVIDRLYPARRLTSDEADLLILELSMHGFFDDIQNVHPRRTVESDI